MLKGLTYHQVQESRDEFGPNILPDARRRSGWGIFADQFKSALVWLLLAAAAVAVILGDRLDGVLIVAIVIINAGIGWWQERKAERAIDQLRGIQRFKVRVIRAARQHEVDSSEVVVGDVVHLAEGGRVPADGRMVEVVGIEIDEAVLTGESLPVEKKRGDEVWTATLVMKGNGWMEVTRVGSQTRFGQLAGSLEKIVEEPTPLQRKLSSLSWGIVAAGSVISIGVALAAGWLTGVSLAVAIIPEGLPAVIVLSLAVGAQRLTRQAAVVRRLGAIEALGLVTVVATDKTGTVTKNMMEVERVYVEGEWWEREKWPDLAHQLWSRTLFAAVMCNTAVLVYRQDHGTFEIVGDQTEGALLKLAADNGLVVDMLRQQNRVVKEYPFNSDLRLMSVVVRQKGDVWVYTKGSPEAVWERCRLSAHHQRVLQQAYQEGASAGLRMIGLAGKRDGRVGVRAEVESGLTWLGMVGIADPLRAEAKATVEHAEAMGVRVMMITGDSDLTARTIAVQAGILKQGGEVMTGAELDQISDEQLQQVLPRVKVFARIRPEHKLRIIKLLQQSGELVAVTGDGVNDVLALKQAEVGVAMGRTGTDVARQVADVVLQDDNLQTISRAITEGRKIVEDMSKSVRYLLSCNLGETLTIVLTVAFGQASPLLPVQILWINLVTDGLPALALAVGRSGKGNVRRNQIVTGWQGLGILGIGMGVGVGGMLLYLNFGRLAVFSGLVGLQMLVAIIIQGKRFNRWLMLAIAVSLALQVVISLHPGLRQAFRV